MSRVPRLSSVTVITSRRCGLAGRIVLTVPLIVVGARKSNCAAEWCAARGADLPDLALRFALANPSVASTLVGMRTAAEVEKNLAALEPGPYDTLIPELREMLRPVLDVEWPSGLPENNPPTLRPS